MLGKVVLSGKGLNKFFGGVGALQDMNIELHEGELLGLVGPNGAGKTTLFKAITGAIKLDSGTVRFFDEDITNLSPNEVSIKGLIKTNQIPRPFSSMTLKENTTVAGMFSSGLPQDEAEELAEEALEFVGLQDKKDELPNALGFVGMKTLEIARAMAADPKVLLLDEPASGLTELERKQVIERILKLQKEKGISIIWVEHIFEAICENCGRVVVMHNGQKLSAGTPDEVMSNDEVKECYLGDKLAARVR